MLEDNSTETPPPPPPAPSSTQITGGAVDLPVQQVPLSYFNALLSPCVAAKIFNLVKEEAQDKIDFKTTPIPFLLGSVCNSWRKTVSMDPRMWDTIVIRLSKRKFDAQLGLLQDWILRSGQRRPLYCYVAVKKGKRNPNWTPPFSFAKLIIEMSSRWKVFECSSRITALSRELEAQGHDFSLLSKMKIYHSTQFKLDFSNATQLRDLVVSATQHKFLVENLNINWANLTSLGIEDQISITQAIEMVKKLVDIQSLSLRISTSFSPVAPDQVPRTLPHLSTLTLSATSSHNITAFLNAITTPSLQDLCLLFTLKNGMTPVNSNWLQPDPSGLFRAFPLLIHRSLFSLDRFMVTYPMCWHLRVAFVMRHIASLAGLSIDNVANDEWVTADMHKDSDP